MNSFSKFSLRDAQLTKLFTSHCLIVQRARGKLFAQLFTVAVELYAEQVTNLSNAIQL